MPNNSQSKKNEVKDFQSFFARSLFSSSFKNYFYGFFGQLFKVGYNRKTKKNTQLGYEIFINTVFALQVVSLAWYPNMNVNNWTSYKILWQLMGWASYDSICANFGIMNFCFYGTISLLGICLISFTIFGFYIYINKDPPVYISFWPRKIAKLLTTFCLIPSTLILLVVAKYSLIDAEKIDEYGGLPSSMLDFNLPGFFVSVLGIVVLFSINIYSEYFSCDIKHFQPKKNIKSRSCSLLDFQIRLFYILTCVSFVVFVNQAVLIHQSVLLSYSLFIGYKSFYVLQYFNILENIIIACKLSMICSTLLFFILGELLDSASIIIALTIFLQPALFLLVIKLVRRNYARLKNNAASLNNQFEFEKKFRHLLIDEDYENKFGVLDLFKTYWKRHNFYKDKLFAIWEFNYCLSIIKDERLARVKLSKIANLQTSFEGEIQEWRLFAWLVKRKCKAFPETSYLEFLKEFSRIRAQDEELCYVLIEFQAEASLKAPRIDKIINYSERTANYIKILSEDYKNLCDKYKNVEGFEIYGSFLENITNNHEEAGLINRKNKGLDYYNKHNEAKNLENYGKDVPILLVSCSDNNIMYLNEKASLILKTSIGNIIGTSLLNFIPKPFDAYHTSTIKEFVFNSSTVELSSHKNLCFQNVQGYLIECNFLIKLAAFHNSAYFLITFEQRKTAREIAIISDDGFILGHSELFHSYIGSTLKNLKGQNISSAVPSLEITKMKDYEPWIIPFNDKEIAFIKSQKHIKSKIINEFKIIHDDLEVKNWKEGLDNDQLKQLANFEIEKSQIEENDWRGVQAQFLSASNAPLLPRSSAETEVCNNEEFQVKEIPPKRNEDKKSGTEDYSKSSASSKFSNKAKSLLSDTKRKIRILQVTLFLVVSSVVVIVSAILGYMITDVSYTTSLSSFKNLSDLLYDLGLAADSARLIDLSKLTNASDEQINSYIAGLEKIILDLEAIQGTILEDLSQWSYCSSSEIVLNAIIPLLYFDTYNPSVKYSNLYDSISEIIFNCKGMIKAISENESYLKYIRFIQTNSAGYLYDRANSTMDWISDCEIKRIKNTGTYINFLLISGFFALGMLVLVVVGYIFLVSRKYDEFWGFILNTAQSALAKLKSSAIDRLMLIHGIDYNSELNMHISGNQKKRKVRTTFYLQYISRIMIFFVVAASYYFLISLYLYPDCEDLMVNRQKLLSNFNMRRSNIRWLSMFSREANSHYFEKNSPQYIQFPNAWTRMNTASGILKLKNKELRENGLKNLMSQELRENIYRKVDSSHAILNYGTDAAINSIIEDCETKGIYQVLTSTNVISMLADIVEIQDEISREFLLANRDSRILIHDKLDSIINTTVAYTIALFMLYFCYYLQYLNRQIKYLNRFSILPEILPMDLE
ncbi:unnamed protein product [Blepharisma stoltei]|uniref:TmcB/TmcC TPR repeats domain-containing protein n=1 Tax=Blepharisma stoltei TaxID=1481888 RepID=A0AAU9IVC6_9CILI|nr:unnamed protein product [Blepharisma stoltei]